MEQALETGFELPRETMRVQDVRRAHEEAAEPGLQPCLREQQRPLGQASLVVHASSHQQPHIDMAGRQRSLRTQLPLPERCLLLHDRCTVGAERVRRRQNDNPLSCPGESHVQL
eukprot:6225068-Alexandrium_andersonii.AAC.1